MRRLLFTLLAVLTASPALAQQPEGRGAVHVAVGHFDGTGVYGDDFAFILSNLSAEVGAEAHVLRRSVLTGTLGATFRMAASEAGIGEDAPDPFTSSFRLQHLDLYARLAGAYATATAGFVVDLGPDVLSANLEDEPDTPFHFLNSDMQHAVRLGLSGEVPAGRMGIHGSIDGFLTLPRPYTATYRDIPQDPDTSGELVTIDGEIDFGDQIVLRAGGAYGLGMAEVGLDLAYAVTTEGEEVRRVSGIELPPGFPDGEFREPIASRYVLSLIPHLTLAPPGSPFEARLAAEAPGGAYSDHVPFGITLAGNNQPKVRLPLSLRVRYGF